MYIRTSGDRCDILRLILILLRIRMKRILKKLKV